MIDEQARALILAKYTLGPVNVRGRRPIWWDDGTANFVGREPSEDEIVQARLEGMLLIEYFETALETALAEGSA